MTAAAQWHQRLELEPASEAQLDAVTALEAGLQAFPWSKGHFADSIAAGHSVWVAPPARIAAAWAHPGVHRVLRQMAPALLGVSVAHISLLINTQIASHVGIGAVSWLTYADRLMEFPTALLGVALGVVLLPQLAAARSRDDGAAYSAMLDWGLRMVLMLALPCAVALLVFPQPLIAVVFHYGRFSAFDVDMTTRALMGYGVGLMGLIGVKVLAPGFFARQDTKTPVKIAIVVLAATPLGSGRYIFEVTP